MAGLPRSGSPRPSLCLPAPEATAPGEPYGLMAWPSGRSDNSEHLVTLHVFLWHVRMARLSRKSLMRARFLKPARAPGGRVHSR
ncbi:hypothetical protein NDU88_000892 [Pleurodeles waltl]|uniref:Uncharacterized protein n=1 Tax=Pleurodeles waltl TaxID=8319 RepID=A0AAV7TH64_PLEWA|nr:hypothetical protein NDU88_000892 [Pleurodeles waltl]